MGEKKDNIVEILEMRPRNKEHMFALGKMFCTEKYPTYL